MIRSFLKSLSRTKKKPSSTTSLSGLPTELLESLSNSEEFKREIYLIFQNSFGYPGSKYMKRGFEHVFALERQALGWICHDPSMSDYLSVIMPATWEVDMAQTYADLNPESTVVKLFVTKSPQAKYFRWGWINCIGVVQYLLGVYWPWVLTPYRLYLKILSNSSSHIKVGKLWQAKAQRNKQEQQQPKRKAKLEDFVNKQHY